MSATLPLGSNPGAGCMGDAKGDPIGNKLTSHASSCKVCSGVFGVNPVDSLLRIPSVVWWGIYSRDQGFLLGRGWGTPSSL